MEPKKSISSDNLSAAAAGDSGAGGMGSGKKGAHHSVHMREFPDEDGEYVPEVEEIRVSPVVSRKGYLNFRDEKTNGWIKRWVVRHPIYIYYNRIYNK